MAKNKQSKKLRIATLLLSAIMVVAACSFFITACSSSGNEDDSSSSETRTDTQTFANGNFEYFSDSDGSYRIGSPESWTSSTGSNSSGVSASSSVAKSGIVDTSIDWTEFVNAYNTYNEYKDADDEDKPDPYYTDIDNNYDIPGWDLAKAASGDEDPADDALKTSAKDLNPGTPFAAKEAEDETNGTHVLMLHNYRSNKMGTAARYTSSTITLAAGTAAEISVWVKTSDLTYNDGTPVDGNRGAYIKINSNVGGTSQNPLVVRNIDTSDIPETENNGWEQFTFYINASPYATTTFSVELGLGMQTDGKETNYLEYVQGYAFFDDLKYTVMQSADFDSKISSVPAGQALTLNLEFDSDLEKLDATKVTSNYFSIDLDTTDLKGLSINNNVTIENTKSGKITVQNLSFADELLADYDKDMSRSGRKLTSDFTEANGYASKFIKDFEKFNTLPFGGASEEILVLYSSHGAPYTATLDSSNVGDLPFELGKDESMLISFWVKTSDLQSGTGATITVIDGDNETSIGAVDTTTLTTVDLVDDEKKSSKEELEKYEDIFDGWQQCFFFITNSTDEEKTFSLEFSYGPKDFTSSSAISSFMEGYAAFTGFRWQKLTEEEYAIKSTGTYAVEVSLTGSETSVSNTFDDVATTDQTKIKTDIANLKNYTGVYGGSTYVGGTGTSGINENAYAGVINKDYTTADREAGTGYSKDLPWVQTLANAYDIDLTNDGVLNSALWNAAFGDDLTQPLLITNQEAQAYGFYANSSTNIAASSFAEITVRMKLSAGATANVYLIDSTDKDFGEKKYTDTLSFSSGVSYRYDSKGNVVIKDPDDKDFSSKTDILFYKHGNGLWATAKDYSGDIWYANLANYKKDKDGNLIDSDENIVYYASSEDGVYYRYKTDDGKLEVKVSDFSKAPVDAEKLAQARIQNAATYGLSKQVKNDTEEVSDWIYVRFFIATGDESKDYRLEVWSGDRSGTTTNPAGSFVIFDIVSASYTAMDGTPLSENLEKYAESKGFADSAELLKDYEKDPAKYITADGSNSLVYYNFSLFDDDDYKSFDADRTDDSDPYASYDPSSYSNSVAYFTYNFTSSSTAYYDTYVNFGTYEVSVAASSEDDSTTEDDTTTAPDYNVWLLAASIILAAALIFTLVALLIRKLLANIRKKSVHNKPMYDNKRKRYIRKLKLEEADREEDEGDDVLPDEDEISEEDIYKVDDTITTDSDDKTVEISSDDDNHEQPVNSDEENK